MGKHDELSHQLHIPKAVKFKQPEPNANTKHYVEPPQKPKPGTQGMNQYR